MLSTGTLLALDILLMSGLFFFLKRKAAPNTKPDTKPVVRWKTPGEAAVKDLASVNKKEVLEETLPELRPEASGLEDLEKSLSEKEKKLESLIERVEENLKNIDLLYEEQLDVYGVALRMLRKGGSREDISNKLGLLNGEAELLESINNYRTP